MTKNTLKITFQEAADHRQNARNRLQRAEAGGTGDAIEQDVQLLLNFESFDDIARLTRPTSLELIEAITSEQPRSIRDLAAIVDRDYREVHRNCSELEALGVIEYDDAGVGKRPLLRGGATAIDLSIRFPRSRSSPSESRA